MENKMKKDLGVLEAVFPMPVLMIATYNEDGTVNVMTAAWGQICDFKQIALFLDEGHKTAQNILKTKEELLILMSWLIFHLYVIVEELVLQSHK